MLIIAHGVGIKGLYLRVFLHTGMLCVRIRIAKRLRLLQTHFNVKQKITLNYPKHINICSYGIVFLEAQERVRNSRGRRVGVRAIKVVP